MLADEIDGLTYGFRRVHADGSSPNNEYVSPYGFVIPQRKCLVVTDLSYYSAFTRPQSPGSLTQLRFALLTVNPNGGWGQLPIFEATCLFSTNGAIGGNVTMHTGPVIGHGHFFTVSFLDSDLVSTYVFVYGYLDDAP